MLGNRLWAAMREFGSGWDWNNRATRDAAVVLAVALAAYGVTEYFDLPHWILAFTIEHQEWDLDDILVASLIIAVALAIFAVRRLQDLSREVTARRLAEESAHALARRDPLTGLPNRRAFTERLEAQFDRPPGPDREVALLVFDLDGFKAINDGHGHIAGDVVLAEMAARIATALPEEALLSRIGGDEFAAIIRRGRGGPPIEETAARVVAAVGEPWPIGAMTATLGVCIGVATAPADARNPAELVRRADLALYRAKAQGRSSVRRFEPFMEAEIERRTQLEGELRKALAGGAIVPHYQPLVELATNRIVGFEALARWHSAEHGAVDPGFFIALAEETGLIHQLGDSLLRSACREARRWPEGVGLSFNISPTQLRDATLGLRILAILGETGLDPTRLELEVTESAIVGDLKTAHGVIEGLRAAGVRIALDDFGTGYASMSQLLALRFDRIKIDRSFVRRLTSDADSAVIVRTIVGLANGLGLATTAEGIEDIGQLVQLRAGGCQEGQGYLFGAAMPAEAIPALLGATRSDCAAG